MLTVAEETLQELAAAKKKQVATHLYGQEITIECLEYLRPQEQYGSLEALKSAIAADVRRIEQNPAPAR